MGLKSIKKILRICIFLCLAVSFSCEEQGWFVNCSDCTPEEPEKAELIVKLSDSSTSVRVTVYDGKLEDNVVYDFADTNSPEFTFSVSLNKKYTVTARYIIGGNSYTAVDSAAPKVKFTEDQCDASCYYVYDREVNLRLKYKER